MVRGTDDQATASRRASQHRRPGAGDSEFLDQHNAAARPFAWTKSADEILASIARFAQRTLAAHSS